MVVFGKGKNVLTFKMSVVQNLCESHFRLNRDHDDVATVHLVYMMCTPSALAREVCASQTVTKKSINNGYESRDLFIQSFEAKTM